MLLWLLRQPCLGRNVSLVAAVMLVQNAARALNAAWGVPYSSIELTPMIGGNDITREVFKLSDVQVVTQFARASGLAGLHLWSLDRDTDCPPGPASPTCNSYGQAGVLGFTRAFMAS